MKRISCLDGALCALVGFIAALAGSAQAGTVTSLYAVPPHVDGSLPNAPLVKIGGKLYGTLYGGGADGGGAVFSVDPRTGREAIVHSFTDNPDGSSPVVGLTVMGRKLFGTTEFGGPNYNGTVFEIDPATGAETVLVSQYASGPPFAPMLGYHGLLYGTLYSGGTGYGSLFTVDPSTGKDQTVFSFKAPHSGKNDAARPSSALIQAGGMLYSTSKGGGQAGLGTIYAFDPATAAEKTLYSFQGGSDGADPIAPLVYVAGTLYGTSGGGTRNKGVVFSFDLATSTERVLYAFTGKADGGTLQAGLLSANGVLYGLAATGGQFGNGVLFSIDPASGKETTLHDFTKAEGTNATGGLIDVDGILYGTLRDGGLEGQYGPGTVFSFDPGTNTETTLHLFSFDNTGNTSAVIPVGGTLYGTTVEGGSFGLGTIFKIDRATGAGKIVYSFTGHKDGLQPLASLIETGGLLYGSTLSGGSGGGGTVFSFDPSTSTLSTLHAFSGGADGAAPSAAMLAVNGMLYGTTPSGGASNDGTVFRIDPSSGEESVVYSFQSGSDGATPQAGLIAEDGLLYGVTRSGGNAHCGTLYSLDPATGGETVLYAFKGAQDGCEPVAALLYDDGLLYGSTFGSGSYKGTVFSFDPAGTTQTVLHTFRHGHGPTAPLIAVGKTLYSTSEEGGYGYGSIVSVNPRTGKTETLYSFGVSELGYAPMSALTYVDGTFYGTPGTFFDETAAGLVFTFVE